VSPEGSQWIRHRPDADLVALISNRRTIVDHTTAPAATRVTWTGPGGNATITFTAANGFTGTAQFPGEGPVGYRGTFFSARPETVWVWVAVDGVGAAWRADTMEGLAVAKASGRRAGQLRRAVDELPPWSPRPGPG
jgi:OAA-family lectin sugar binding domain